MKEYNHTLVLKEENVTNVDLRNKVFRNIEEEVDKNLTYKIQKNTCFNNKISLFSHEITVKQDELIKLRKY